MCLGRRRESCVEVVSFDAVQFQPSVSKWMRKRQMTRSGVVVVKTVKVQRVIVVVVNERV